jgi:phage shock protein C
MSNTKSALYRLPKEGKIAGVCAGLAEYFDFDVTLMRIIWVVAALASGGFVVLLYILLAVILPVKEKNDDVKNNHKPTINIDNLEEKVERLGQDLHESSAVRHTRNYFGAGLVILGLWIMLSQFVPGWFNIRWSYIWPFILIFLGLIIMLKGNGYGKK